MKTEVKIIQACGALVNFEGAGVLEILDAHLIVTGGPTGQNVCKIPLGNLQSVSVKGALLIISASEAECSVEFTSPEQQNKWAQALRALLPSPGIKHKIKLLSLVLIASVVVAVAGYYYGTIYIQDEKEICKVSAELVDQLMGEPCCTQVISLKKKSMGDFTGIAVLNDGTRFMLDITRQGRRIGIESADPVFLSAAISRKATRDRMTAMLKKVMPQGDFQCLRVEEIKSSPEFCTGVAVLNDGTRIKIRMTAKELRIEPEDLERISLMAPVIADATEKLNYYKVDSGRCVRLEGWQSTGKPDCYSGIAVMDGGQKYKIKIDVDRDGQFLSIPEPEFAKQWALEILNERLKKNNSEFTCKDILKVKTIGDEKYSGILLMSNNMLGDIEFEVMGRYLGVGKITPRL